MYLIIDETLKFFSNFFIVLNREETALFNSEQRSHFGIGVDVIVFGGRGS